MKLEESLFLTKLTQREALIMSMILSHKLIHDMNDYIELINLGDAPEEIISGCRQMIVGFAKLATTAREIVEAIDKRVKQ